MLEYTIQNVIEGAIPFFIGGCLCMGVFIGVAGYWLIRNSKHPRNIK